MLIKEASIDYLDELSELEKHINFKKLKEKIESKEMLMIMSENRIIGWIRFSFFWDEHPFINMLYIIEEYRGRGYGTRLVAYWEEKMKQLGYVTYMTSTQSNEDAQHFYRKLGYKDIGGFIMPDEPLELIMIKTAYI
jgi:ribosomal protein S18 acetylase RimI-like enzyme